MESSFLDILNSSNSIKNEETGEITLTVPVFNTKSNFTIFSSCNLNSNCNTVITSDTFQISSSSVSISNITFESSVVVTNSTNVSIKNCHIKNSQSSNGALTITNSENISISHVTIAESNKIPGLYVNQNSIVTADNLNIQDLEESLVVCHDQSYISITNSTLSNSQANGFYISGQSYVEIGSTSIINTNYPAIYVTGSESHIRRCTVQKVKSSGINITQNSTAIVEETTFSEIDGNCIFSSNSKLQTKNNKMSGMVYPGIAVSSKSKATLSGDSISKISTNGIVARSASEVTIDGCEVFDVKDSGISISDTEQATVQGCKISRCGVTAIETYNNSKSIIKLNEIETIEKFAFMVYTKGFMHVEGNKIKDVKLAMAKLVYKGGGEFVNNFVSGCDVQCQCSTSSYFFFSKNDHFDSITNDKSKVTDDVKLYNCPVVENNLCLNCNKNKRSVFLLDCGHKVFCNDCAQMALKNKENCPLCRFPIVKISNGFGMNIDDDSCIICLENKPDCILMPCGHMGVCSKCIENWFKNKECCPICRSEPCFYKKIENY